MGHEPLQLRVYGTGLGDYQVVSAWWQARHGQPFPETLVPPDAVIVERAGKPVAFLCCYLSYGVGVAFLEFAVTRPGLGFKVAREAMTMAINGCVALAHGRGDFSFFRCNTVPAIGRVLLGLGFLQDAYCSTGFSIHKQRP
jgi:hypothetical protein